jgi:hypothetical protein
MNLSSCLVLVAAPLKRWSMVFALAMAAIYCALPGAARADFTLQYTGAAFNDTPLCGVTTDPYVACIGGHLAMSFDVQGDLPTARPSTFCLALNVIGQPQTGCLTVTSGTINAGGTNIPLLGNSKDTATLTLSPGLNFWNVSLTGLSSASPSTGLFSGENSDQGGDIVTIHDPDGSRALGLITAAGAWAVLPSGVGQGTPFGANAQFFGILANGSVLLAQNTTIRTVQQFGTAPKIGAATETIGGPASYLMGDLVTSATSGRAILVSAYDKVDGQCVTAGGSVVTGTHRICGSIDTTGNNALLTTLSNAQSEAKAYASSLASLAPTRTLGDIKLEKFRHLTIKLGAGVSVVSIDNLTTGGANIINVSAPSGAVVVFNISGTMALGSETQVIVGANGFNPEDLIWNVQSANPTFGDHVALDGTLLNFPATDTTVTFGAESLINGAVLTNGNVMTNGAMHLNFWPFSGALTPTP